MKVAALVFAALFAVPAAAYEHTLEHWHSLWAMGRLQQVGEPKPSPALYYLELQPRVRLDEPRPLEVIFRAALGWELAKDLTLFAGVAAIPAFDAPVWVVNETRLFQQIQYIQNIERVTLLLRGRFEERLFADRDAALRARALLRASYKLPVLDDQLSVIVWDEAFVRFDAALTDAYDAYDQNRLFGGIGYKFASWFSIEAGYMNVLRGLPDDDGSQMRHVISLTTVVNLL